MSSEASEASETLLTPRQLEVLELMAKGLTNKEIGNVLEISAGTAKVHVAAVIRALDVTNRTEATNRLHELGLGADQDPVESHLTVPGFGSRPAIAVLPFQNFSTDPEHEFLADGIVEDLITGLAAWRWYPVIARNSSFAYKGKAIDIKEVSRSLGAGYVIEGSVRAMGDRIRITVQVIEGTTAEHVWVEQYDRQLADVFEGTDEIVASMVASIEPALVRIHGLRVLTHSSDQPDAWACLHRAIAHVSENSVAGFLEAQAMLDRAIELDPRFSSAWAFSSYCQFHLHHLGQRVGGDDPVSRLDRIAAKLHELDAADPYAPLAAGMSRMAHGDRQGAVQAMRRSVELAPSLTYALWGMSIALSGAGELEEAVEWLERMFRLSPKDPLLAPAHANYGILMVPLGRLSEAEEALQASFRIGPGLPYSYAGLAIFHHLRDEHEQARAKIERMYELCPGYSVLRSVRIFLPPEHQGTMDGLLDLVGLGSSSEPGPPTD